MPLAVAYTETQLATFMSNELGDVATALGWAVNNVGLGDPGSYQQAVNRTLRAYGDITSIAGATDMAKLEALATWQAWEAATSSLAARYDLSTDGQSMSRSQVEANAMLRLRIAKAAALPYMPGYAVSTFTPSYDSDPYATQPAITVVQ